jgi:hypothetical protein
MTRPAVTEEIPAVSSEPNFLPTDKNYLLTGEMPAETTEDTSRAFTKETPPAKDDEAPAASTEENENEPGNDDASAASSSKAAASETAQPQTRRENRWQKRERELRELRQENARLKSQSSQPQQRSETQQTSQAATETTTAKPGAAPEPQIDDTDPKTGKAKFADWKAYQTAHDTWNRQEAIREFQELSSKTQREQQQTEAEKIIDRTVNERVAEVRKLHSDYNDVIAQALAQKDEHGQDAFFYTKGSPLDGFFLDSERGHEVMYEIGKNFEQHQHIFARDAQGKYLLNPVRQVRELAKIENSLPDLPELPAPSGAARSGQRASSSSSARPITQAARPPHQVSGTGTVAKDAVEQAVEDGDSETYIRAQNAKELARLKRK